MAQRWMTALMDIFDAGNSVIADKPGGVAPT
jgi:hypothetical protein